MIKMNDDSQWLEIEGVDNIHINSVEIFTGGDDYKQTDSVIIKVLGDKLNIQNNHKKNTETPTRIRMEPGLKIHLSDETDGPGYILTLSHHKGNIKLDCVRVKE